MKRIYENPEMTVAMFVAENIITTSAVDNVAAALKDENSGVLINNTKLNETSNILMFKW